MEFDIFRGKLVDFTQKHVVNEITVPEGVTAVKNCAFMGAACCCIKLPASLKEFNANDLGYCENLINIEVDTDNEFFSSFEGMLYNKERTDLIFCPFGRTADIVIPEGVIEIDEYAFNQCNNIKTISLPGSVTEIKNTCFSNCENLDKITVNENNSIYISYDGALYKNLNPQS